MNDPGFDPEFAAASDWAKLYRANGVQVVPCKNKIPRLKSWKEYQNALVPDAQFDAWYGHGGEFATSYDMGMLTGTASGHILMIDLDFYKAGGDKAKQWWGLVLMTHNNGMILETWQQRTGGGGIQMFFTYPPGWKFAVNAKTDIDVDIRCQGGFAVLPPTLHASGANYVWEAGFAPWEIPIAAAPSWLLEEVERLVREHGGGHGQNPSSNGEGFIHTPRQNGNGQTAASFGQANAGQFDAFGHRIDGRETTMRDMVWRVVLDWSEACPIKPSDAESAYKARQEYEVYERDTGPKKSHPADMTLTQMLDAEGRGWDAWWGKWQRAMAQWDTTVYEEARRKDRPKEKTHQGQEGFSPYTDYTEEYAKSQTNDTGAPAGDIFEMLSVADIKALPDPQWLVEGMVVEQALGFIYGPPGCLKTYIALNMGLTLATSQPRWWGRNVQRQGTVLYICSEGVKSLKFRIQAWELHHKVPADTAPFALIRQNINFMHPDDVNKLLRTVQAAQGKWGPIAAVFVDTISRVLPGAEENLQKDMTMFVAACDAVRQLFGATVIGLHHTNASGGFRGSTVMPGAGDFLVEVRREPGAGVGSIYAKKIKDDEDGWEQAFKTIEIPLPGIVARTNLVVESDAAPEPREGGNRERASFDVRVQVLAELHKAWGAGDPWSHSFNSPRSGAKKVMIRWGLSREAAVKILDTWLALGIIKEDTFSTKLHIKGYRKLKDL